MLKWGGGGGGLSSWNRLDMPSPVEQLFRMILLEWVSRLKAAY